MRPVFRSGILIIQKFEHEMKSLVNFFLSYLAISPPAPDRTDRLFQNRVTTLEIFVT